MSNEPIGFCRKTKDIKADWLLNQHIRSFSTAAAKPPDSIGREGGICPKSDAAETANSPSWPTGLPAPLDHAPSVFFGGFLGDWAGLSGLCLGADLNDRLEKVVHHWAREINGAVWAHHLIFEVAPDLEHRLVKGGFPIDYVLMSSALQAVNICSARGLNGAWIGHLAGIHCGAQGNRLHMLIYPLDSKGRRVIFSHRESVVLQTGETCQVDFLGHLRDAYCDSLRAFKKALTPTPIFSFDESSQGATRLALRSVPLAAIVSDMLRSADTQNGIKRRGVDIMVDLVANNREPPLSPAQFEEMQRSARKAHIDMERDLRTQPEILAKRIHEFRSKLNILAANVQAKAEIARDAAAAFAAAYGKYANSALAHRNARLGDSSLELPMSLFDYAEIMQLSVSQATDPTSKSLEVADAFTELSMRRSEMSSSFGWLASSILLHVDKDSDALFGAFYLAAAAHARLRAARAADERRTPFFLLTKIASGPSDPPLNDADGGLARIEAEIKRSADELRLRCRPRAGCRVATD